MIRRLGLLGIVLALLWSPASAFAQVQTGSILVKALDEQGNIVPGATVSLSSPIMPSETIGVTDEGGVYRASGLGVGMYRVKTSLSGFQTMIREGVVVTQGQTVTIAVAMTVSALAEEITVTGEAPVIDTKSATVNVNLDARLLETTPGGKDIWNILEYKVPGLVFGTPDVGGNQGGLQRGFTARGTPNSENQQFLNGANVGDPAALGFAMNYYDPSSFQNIQVSTGAQDIALGTSGVVINMVTKSGTNRLTGQALQTYQGHKTQWDNIDEPLKQAGFRPEANATAVLTNSNWQAGFPFIKNKLFYFGAYNFQATHINVPGFPAIVPPAITTVLADTSTEDTTDIKTISSKLTYRLSSSHQFDMYAQKQWYDKPNRGANSTTTQDSNSKEYDIDNTLQGLWNWTLTDRMTVTSNISYNNVHFPLSQKTGLQPLQDSSTNVQHRNRTSTANMFRRRLDALSNWEYSLPEFAGGRHQFKAGFSNSYTPEDVETTRVDDVTLTWRSLQGNATQPPGPAQVTIFNSPLHVKRAANTTAFYGQDSYSIDRLTLTAGVRWERVVGYLPAQQDEPSQYFPEGLIIRNVTLNGVVQDYTSRKSFAAVKNAPLWKDWAPRFQATYDLLGKGKTVAKFSIGKYLDQIGTGTPGPNPNGTISQQYVWNDLNGDLNFQPGNAVWDGTKYVGGEFGATVGTITIPNPNPFDTTLLRVRRNEWTAGVDHELFPGLRLSTTFIHRRELKTQGTIDLGIDLWDSKYSKVTVTEPGRDGLSGTADDAAITAYNLNRNPDGTVPTLVTRTVNDDRLGPRYNGLEITAEKRYSRGWTLLGGYTYAHTEVDLTSLANPNNAFVNASGQANTDRRHLFKLTGSAQLPYQIVFGANLKMQSGLPITRTYAVQTCTAAITTNCLNQNNVTLNVEPRGSVTLSALKTFDMRIGRVFTVGTHQVELDMDVFNVANANTVYDVATGSTLRTVRYANDPTQPPTVIPNFLSANNILGPRIIRFNLVYKFGGR